jgi:hypothetical protein
MFHDLYFVLRTLCFAFRKQRFLIAAACLLLVLFGGSHNANASVLYFNPQDKIEVEDGGSTIVDVWLDTEGKTVNAADVILGFPANLVEVSDVSRGDSVLQLWLADPDIDNVAGTVRLEGGIPRGSAFKSGLLARLTFLGKAQGGGTIAWSRSSQILLNDGRGTQDSVQFLETPIVVAPTATDVPKIASPSHPDQSKWYKDSRVMVHWDMASEEIYSYSFDHDPKGSPDEIADTPLGNLMFQGSLKYEGLNDGVYYFHLRAGTKDAAGSTHWSRTRTFRAQVDLTPPEIRGSVDTDPSVFGGRPFASFAGSDVTSGIDRYDIWESREGWIQGVKAPYELRDGGKGGYISVRAVDKAGNEKELKLQVPAIASAPAVWPYVSAGAALLMLLVSSLLMGWNKKKRAV